MDAGTPSEQSKTDDLKAKAQAGASRYADQAGKYAQKYAGVAGERLKHAAADQWKVLRERAPELLFATPEDAAMANARRTEANLAFYRENPSLIASRLDELDEEWDTRRVLQVATSGLTLGSFWMSMTKSRFWTLLPVALAGGALHHGLTGQSPAEDLVRRLGFRTRDEIEFERRALLKIDIPGSEMQPEMTKPNMG